MTLSFKSALLPTMLAISLALSACQDASVPTDANIEAADTNMSTENADVDNNTATLAKASEMSAEEQMIANLARYRWTLLDIDDKSGGPVITTLVDIKNQVTLLFKHNQGHNTLNYGVGCNTMSAGYQLQGHTLTTEDSMSTKMLCENLNKAENSLDTLMQGTSEISVTEGENPVLTQVTSNAVTLTWKGRLTSQAKYNGKGETVFWAVNANKIACADNSSEMCLQVKPITYNDQGIKTSEGKWSAFNGEIDGYQYDGKHNEVLRIQRYSLNQGGAEEQNAAAEKYAYVLDAVIESSVVE
ncbi:conserved hypothetical protein [Psychrobacter arcticus 273-4]|uniref:DUF4377 domain-containing protein n=1 Tax=Psychrobacter arcticus (strain DSM 17307 / VKM B-2377 / 273-4) TaxID=259536 RepID=Q4FTV1_PSYA2|nr:DUF4377 domain-containing protein [Psychrobacter arcticus]AAZ18557.1 conserved hypothetical protein [Psychrobacter arcticus 273-4]